MKQGSQERTSWAEGKARAKALGRGQDWNVLEKQNECGWSPADPREKSRR